MEEKIKKILSEAKTEIKKALDLNSFNQIKSIYLGKQSIISDLLKSLKDIDKEKRPEFGQKINFVRIELEQLFDNKFKEIQETEIKNKLNKEKIDITLDKFYKKIGTLHPTTKVINEILDIFLSFGFSIEDGPEVELDLFNFQLLNIPKDHPARDMQDTFYIQDDLLLRTQTSPIQARVMKKQQPPIKIITPGKVYRPDDDASHSPMFQQIEGLVIDENITMCDLKGLLLEFAKKLFDKDTKIRLRPSYFPFTEPSVEVDVTCAICHGKGCRVCKHTGWLEILGAGIVNPQVLDNCGIDSKKYSGLAFGLGVERIAMIKYAIPDIRLLFKNDIRFLEQYED